MGRPEGTNQWQRCMLFHANGIYSPLFVEYACYGKASCYLLGRRTSPTAADPLQCAHHAHHLRVAHTHRCSARCMVVACLSGPSPSSSQGCQAGARRHRPGTPDTFSASGRRPPPPACTTLAQTQSSHPCRAAASPSPRSCCHTPPYPCTTHTRPPPPRRTPRHAPPPPGRHPALHRGITPSPARHGTVSPRTMWSFRRWRSC